MCNMLNVLVVLEQCKFTGYASAADPNPRFLEGQMPGGSDTSLESQIAAWRLRLLPGGSDCSLEAQIASQRLGLQLGGSARWPFGTPGCNLEFHRWPFAAPGGHLEFQDALWSSRCPFGAAGGHLELQVGVWSSRGGGGGPGVWQPVPACGSLWQPVAACGGILVPLAGRGFGSLCRPVAACGSLWRDPRAPIKYLYSKIPLLQESSRPGWGWGCWVASHTLDARRVGG